jgi:hypothetical protein
VKKYNIKDVNYILDQTRKKGRNGDKILAHINPLEAMMLKKAGGSGTINPDTGLPEFFFRGVRNFFRNPGKTIGKTLKNPKRTIADTIGTAAAIFGGPVGGALGGAARSVIRGDKENPLMGALKGAGYGVALPMVGNLAGQGLSKLGANSIGQTLQNYGTKNMGSWLGNIGQMGEGVRGLGLPFTGADKSLGASDYLTGGAALSGGGGDRGAGIAAGSDADDYLDYMAKKEMGGDDSESYMKYLLSKKKKEDSMGFFDKLASNSKNFLTDPKNLLSVGTAGLSLYDRFNRPKPKSAAQEGKDAKAKLLAQRLSPEEMAQQEAYELEQERAKRRIARKKFLPEERIDIEPIYNRVSSPQEYSQTGRWLNYYNNPQFSGTPIRF